MNAMYFATSGDVARFEVQRDVFIGNLLHLEGNPGANLKSISHKCYLREVAFEYSGIFCIFADDKHSIKADDRGVLRNLGRRRPLRGPERLLHYPFSQFCRDTLYRGAM